MGRIFKALVFLIVMGFFLLVGFAYIGDLAPQRQPVRQPVTLDVN